MPLVAAVSALLASLVWGTSDFLGGLFARRVNVVALVGWSQLWFLIVVTSVLAWQLRLGPGPAWRFGVIAGVTSAAALVLFYSAMSRGPIGVVAPIASLGVTVPVFVGLARGDQAPVLTWLGVVVAIIGVLLASGPQLSKGTLSWQAAGLAAGAGICFGLIFVFIAFAADSPLLNTIWTMRVTSVAIFLGIAAVARSWGGITPRQQPMAVLVGLTDGSANLLFAVSVSRGLLSLSAVLSSLYPAVTVLWARVYLKEQLSWVQGVGVALTITGAALIAWR